MAEGDVNQNNPTPTPEQITQAATAGPLPNLPWNNNGAASNAPSPPPTAQPSAPAKPTPEQQAAAADTAHHSAIGRAVNFLLGKQRQYVPDPKTGAPVAVDVPQKPGELFRHILASAIIGGAAAQGTRSGIAGFTRGAAAGIQSNMQADAQKRAQAQRDFENRQQVDRFAEEQKKNTAQAEMWNKEQLLHERDANLREAEFIENANTRQDALQKWAIEAGGIPAPIEGNGEFRNGKQLAQDFTTNPQKFRPPAGYTRILTHTIDTSGLTHDATKGWIDGDGNAANLEDRTTWYVNFVPQKTQPLELTGAQLKKTFPDTLNNLDIKDDQVFRIPWNQVVGMAATEHENARKADDLELKKRREKRLQDTTNKDQARKDQDEQRKQKLADQKLQPKPVKIGDIGIVNNQRVMITKLDPQGRPVAGVPVQ